MGTNKAGYGPGDIHEIIRTLDKVAAGEIGPGDRSLILCSNGNEIRITVDRPVPARVEWPAECWNEPPPVARDIANDAVFAEPKPESWRDRDSLLNPPAYRTSRDRPCNP